MFIEGTSCTTANSRVSQQSVTRFDKAEDYYYYLRSESFENCQTLCKNENKCEMSTFLTVFKLCYLYDNTEFKEYFEVGYGDSYLKTNVNNIMMSPEVDNSSTTNSIKKLLILSTLFILMST